MNRDIKSLKQLAVAAVLVLCFAADSRAQKRYEIWRVRGGITVIHLLEGLLEDSGITVASATETATVADSKRLRGERPNMLFAILPESTLQFGVHQGQFHDGHMLGGSVLHEGELTFAIRPRGNRDEGGVGRILVELRDFVVDYLEGPPAGRRDRPTGERFVLRSGLANQRVVFGLSGAMVAFLDSSRTAYYGSVARDRASYNLTNFLDPEPVMWIGYADLSFSLELARRVNRPELANTVIGMLEVNGISSRTGREYDASSIPLFDEGSETNAALGRIQSNVARVRGGITKSDVEARQGGEKR